MALDDKFEDIQKLIDTGKEKGYLTYDQVNDLLPGDILAAGSMRDGPYSTGDVVEVRLDEIGTLRNVIA